MTTPANNVDTTDDGQGGTGTSDVPAVTPDPTDRDAGSDTTGTSTRPGAVDTTTPTPVTGTFDTTTGTDTNPADDPGTDVYAPPTSTAVTGTEDTTTGGGTDSNPADDNRPYVPPAPDVPGSNQDTNRPGGNYVNVNPASPDAAVVGGGDVNPNAVEPGILPSGYDAGREGQGNLDTTGAGTNPNEAAPLDYVAPAPTGVTATVVPGRRAVHVHWTPIADEQYVTAYQVEGSTGGTVRVGKQHDEAEVDEGLEGGRTYNFVVFAVTQNGTGRRSAPSNTVTIPTGDIVNDSSGRDEGL